MAKRQQSTYDITAPQVIAPPSQFNPVVELIGYIQQTAGTAGSLTFNDCATLAEANISNQILSIPFGQAGIGQAGISALNLPITRGLVVSSVPTGGVFMVESAVFVVG